MPHLDLNFSEIQRSFNISDQEMKMWIDVAEVMNFGPYTVQEVCPLSRVVRLFCKLGMRHLVVLDDNNEVSGIITRHDILRLRQIHAPSHDIESK